MKERKKKLSILYYYNLKSKELSKKQTLILSNIITNKILTDCDI